MDDESHPIAKPMEWKKIAQYFMKLMEISVEKFSAHEFNEISSKYVAFPPLLTEEQI